MGYTGAVSLCARAAVRTGAGVVFTGVPEKIIRHHRRQERRGRGVPLADDEAGRFSPKALPGALARLETAAAAVLGPGLGAGRR